MRLATIQTPDGPRAALLQGDSYVDVHVSRPDLPVSVRGLLAAGAGALRAAAEAAARPDAVRHPAASVRLLAPIPDPPKVVCIGLNYRDHAAESGAAIPREPVLFSKFATAIIGPGESIRLPAVSREVDYEAELVLVVGKKGRNLRAADAMDHLAGYTIGHDVSARDWQLQEGRQTMVGRQDLRHLRADRSGAGHGRRGSRSAQSRHPPAPQRADDAGQQHAADDLPRRRPRRLPVADRHARTGRPHLHRHAARRRLRANRPSSSRTATWWKWKSTDSAYCVIPWCRSEPVPVTEGPRRACAGRKRSGSVRRPPVAAVPDKARAS